jgi:Outer membrane protein beta-barrel domain
MSKNLLIFVALLTATLVRPITAQDVSKLTFNVGGGVTTPMNPTAQFAGLSGNFVTGVGYNINNKNSIIGEFMWAGLPPDRFVLHPIDAPFGSINLYSLTANYRFGLESLGRSRFGVYTIAGGGWYYRYSQIDKNYVVPPLTVCTPYYNYWGYACDSNDYVVSQTVAFKGRSAPGVNAGLGFTIRISDSGWKIYMESRYHYAWHDTVRTTVLPVSFGLRF